MHAVNNFELVQQLLENHQIMPYKRKGTTINNFRKNNRNMSTLHWTQICVFLIIILINCFCSVDCSNLIEDINQNRTNYLSVNRNNNNNQIAKDLYLKSLQQVFKSTLNLKSNSSIDKVSGGHDCFFSYFISIYFFIQTIKYNTFFLYY